MTGTLPISLHSGARTIKSALVVAGMHRSGTSALTRTLSLLGLELPNEIMPPAADNPKGFWESSAITQLNDEILTQLDSSWDDILIFLVRRNGLSLGRSATERIETVVRSEFGDSDNIVLKDPRVGLLLTPWITALQEVGYKSRVVLSVRNPLEVAASLKARNGFSIGRSLLLWLTYFLLSEKDSRDEQRAFVHYPSLIEDWRGSMARLERCLDMRFPRWTSSVELQIDSFLSPLDRHQVIAPHVINIRRDVTDWVRRVYDWALAASTGENVPDTRVLDEVAGEFEAALRVFAPLISELDADAKSAAVQIDLLRTELTQQREPQNSSQPSTATSERIAGDAESVQIPAASFFPVQLDPGEVAKPNEEELLKLASALRTELEVRDAKIEEYHRSLTERNDAYDRLRVESERLNDEARSQTQIARDAELRLASLNDAYDRLRVESERLNDEARSQTQIARDAELRLASLIAERTAEQHRHATANDEAREAIASLTELVRDTQSLAEQLRSDAKQWVGQPMWRKSLNVAIERRAVEKCDEGVRARIAQVAQREEFTARAVERYRARQNELLSLLANVEGRERELSDLIAQGESRERLLVDLFWDGEARERGLDALLLESEIREASLSKVVCATGRSAEELERLRSRERELDAEADDLRRLLLQHQNASQRAITSTLETIGASLRARRAEEAVFTQRHLSSNRLVVPSRRRRNRLSKAVDKALLRGRSVGQALSIWRSGLWRGDLAANISGSSDGILGYVRAGLDPDAQTSTLFDQRYYLGQSDNLAGRRVSPLFHYLNWGDAEGRDPHPLISTEYYRTRNADVLGATGLTCLEHFVAFGAKEGLNPHPLFDVKHYLGQVNPSEGTPRNPLAHYLTIGWRRGLNPHALFDNDWYLRTYPDVAEAMTPPLLHYIVSGADRGYSPHPLFSAAWYVASNPDSLWGGRTPLEHFVLNALSERLDPNPHFSSAYYISQTPDVLRTNANPLVHYLEVGAWTGGSPNPNFDAAGYLATFPEALTSARTPLEAWIKSGAPIVPRNVPERPSRHPSLVDQPYNIPFEGAGAETSALRGQYANARRVNAAKLASLIREQSNAKLAVQVAEPRSLPPFIEPEPATAVLPVLKVPQRSTPSAWSHIMPKLRSAFDEAFYLEQANGLVDHSIDALDHYLAEGWLLGLDPNKSLDNDAYLQAHPALLETATPPLVHFVQAPQTPDVDEKKVGRRARIDDVTAVLGERLQSLVDRVTSLANGHDGSR